MTPISVLRVVFTHDFHHQFEPVKVGKQMLGGISRLKTLVDKLRAESAELAEPFLLLDGGDFSQGTEFYTEYKGQALPPLYNALGYNVVAVGNHEFDLGSLVLADISEKVEFPLVSANTCIESSLPLASQVKPWAILNANGVLVGVFGLTPTDTPILSLPGQGVTFNDPITAAKEVVAELKALGVKIIIALSHLGLRANRELAQQVESIALIVNAHDHLKLGDIPGATHPYPIVERSSEGRPVVIVSAWEKGKYLGDIRLGVDVEGTVAFWEGSLHAIDSSIEPDPEFEAKLTKLTTSMKERNQIVIGQTLVRLDGERACVRTRETNFSNLIADAMLEKSRLDGGQIAFHHSGGIRLSIPTGDITMGQVQNALPFAHGIVLLDLTGTQLKEVLENGVSDIENNSGRFLQVAGLRFAWNPKAPCGERICMIQVQKNKGTYQTLEPDTSYRVSTIDFLFNGGESYSILKSGKNQVNTGFLLTDVVMEYIAASSPIKPEVENRIIKLLSVSRLKSFLV
jgi:5'-nucleotidase